MIPRPGRLPTWSTASSAPRGRIGVWHADLTELPTQEGKLFLAVLVDGCSRLVVGHAIGEHADAELAVGALELAIGRRGLVLDEQGGLIATPTP